MRRDRVQSGGLVSNWTTAPQYVNRGVQVSATGTFSSFSSGNYQGLTFTGNGDVTVSNGTLRDVEIIVVAGGGGGGSAFITSGAGGGGGAGGVVYSVDATKLTLDTATYTVVIGAGGAGGSAGDQGSNGSVAVAVAVVTTTVLQVVQAVGLVLLAPTDLVDLAQPLKAVTVVMLQRTVLLVAVEHIPLLG